MISRKNYNDIKEVGINDFVRNKVDKNYKSTLIELSNINDYLFLNIKGSLDSEKKESIIISSTVIPVLFLDSYKILSDKIKTLDANELEISQYGILSNMTSIDDVKEYYKDNDTAIIASLEHVEKFFNLSSLAKIKIMKSLTDDENKYLSLITPIHNNDIEKYNIKIDKNFLYNYYNKQTKYLDNKFKIPSSESVVMMVSNFLRSIFYRSYEDVLSTLESIYNDVFDNLYKILNEDELSNGSFYNQLIERYEKDKMEFINSTLVNLDDMDVLLQNYFIMRKNNLIKHKTYEKD